MATNPSSSSPGPRAMRKACGCRSSQNPAIRADSAPSCARTAPERLECSGPPSLLCGFRKRRLSGRPGSRLWFLAGRDVRHARQLPERRLPPGRRESWRAFRSGREARQSGLNSRRSCWRSTPTSSRSSGNKGRSSARVRRQRTRASTCSWRGRTRRSVTSSPSAGSAPSKPGSSTAGVGSLRTSAIIRSARSALARRSHLHGSSARCTAQVDSVSPAIGVPAHAAQHGGGRRSTAWRRIQKVIDGPTGLLFTHRLKGIEAS